MNFDGVPVQEKGPYIADVTSILAGKTSCLDSLRLRDPSFFMAGEIHANPEGWEKILHGHPLKDMILDWIRNKVDVMELSQHFKGVFRGVKYNSRFPPPKCFPNHLSCRQFSEFVSGGILNRVKTGALRFWGKVGECEPPLLVLPLTVEPTKPRLCVDARFLNLWMRDSPFKLDKLVDVTRYVYRDSLMTKCDDKFGYDHVLLREHSQKYFGIRWEGCWFVCATLPFGWKESPFVYHTTGSEVSSYFRSIGIPCSIYIDDRLQGELLTSEGPGSVLPEVRHESFR